VGAILCLGAKRLGAGAAPVAEEGADEEDEEPEGLIPGLAIVGFLGESGSFSMAIDDAVETGLFNELVLAMPEAPVAAAAVVVAGLPIVFVGPPTVPPVAAGGPLFAEGPPPAALAVGTGLCLALISAFS